MEGDIKGQQSIEDRMKQKIEALEKQIVKMIDEEKSEQRNIMYIGIGICGITFITAAFLYYLTMRNRKQSESNVGHQNE